MGLRDNRVQEAPQPAPPPQEAAVGVYQEAADALIERLVAAARSAGTPGYPSPVQAHMLPVTGTVPGAPGVSVQDAVALGSLLGGAGVEQVAAAGLLSFLQSIAVEIVVKYTPRLMEDVHKVTKARLTRLEGAIRELPEAPITQQRGGFGMLTPIPLPGYVLKSDVLRVVAAAKEAGPTL